MIVDGNTSGTYTAITAASKLQATLALRDAHEMAGLSVEELLEKYASSK